MGLSPIDYPYEWDVIRIGGVTSPGVCKISGWKKTNDWDVKKGKGTLGSTVTFTGREPSKGSVTFYLWTNDHFNRWNTFRKLLKYDTTKENISAVDIYHPSLETIDVKSVVIESIGMIERESGGLYSIQVDMLEYFPPPKKSAVKTPSGSKPTGKNTTPGKVVDPVEAAKQAEIAKLLKEAKEP